MTETIEVYVVTVDHRYGTATFVNKTADGSDADFYAFITEAWNDDDGPVPADHDEAVTAYFDNHPDESYWVTVERLRP
jgi:hypothetical protein